MPSPCVSNFHSPSNYCNFCFLTTPRLIKDRGDLKTCFLAVVDARGFCLSEVLITPVQWLMTLTSQYLLGLCYEFAFWQSGLVHYHVFFKFFSANFKHPFTARNLTWKSHLSTLSSINFENIPLQIFWILGIIIFLKRRGQVVNTSKINFCFLLVYEGNSSLITWVFQIYL